MLDLELALWRFLGEKLAESRSCMLLLVVHHSGSSPGRYGFKMAVDRDGFMQGSIGGGIMEHKLVEWSKKLLASGRTSILLKHQVHQAEAGTNRSGMICSGEQYVALVPLYRQQLSLVHTVIRCLESNSPCRLSLSPKGLSFQESGQGESFIFDFTTSKQWLYQEQLGHQYFLHIVGGGHISRALSQLANALGFHVSVYDDRESLNTMRENSFAHKKQLVSYLKLDKYIPQGARQFVVIMTFGYRTDKVALTSILKNSYGYLGLLGSAAKTRELLDALLEEGFDRSVLEQIDAPAGVVIGSQTPMEIAVSIAGRLIQCRHNLNN